MRVQYKLTLVFILIALFSTLLVGGIAYNMVKRDFSRVAEERIFGTFQKDFVSYVRTYGGLESALRAEPFNAFVLRAHRFQRPGPEVVPGGGLTVGNRWRHPPFRFLVMDMKGTVVLPADGLQPGDAAPRDVMARAVPLLVDGSPVALASPVGEAVLTGEDLAYLSAVRESLVTGAAIAVAFSVLLGLIFGRGVSAAIRGLTRAIRNMQSHREDLHPVEVRSSDELGELAEAFNSMNAELAEAHVELRRLAVRDPLTNLYNRRHFDEQAAKAFEAARRYGHPMTIMIGDLDDFKGINDAFSHETGDRVLAEVARIILGITRKSDVVARYGGEEIVILFANTDMEQAAVSCEHIRRAIESHPWREIAPGLAVTASMGLCGRVDEPSAAAMLACADARLYRAKAEGKNRLVAE
ncbi:MAG: GGDEF domain-containing protein [Pseudodesulfovibrio sp.]|uniref:GGDEF domain-containing protein n=1 Tax=Pseudodesulfovibrio sp. TaxID=2035812 RepID=UPI003D11DABD